MEWTERDVRTWDRTADKGYFYVKIPGRDPKWVSSKQPTKKAAVTWAITQARGGVASTVTVGEFTKDFFVPAKCSYVATREDNGNSRSEKYWRDMRSVVDNYIAKRWGSSRMDWVTAGLFHEWLLNLESTRKGVRLSGRMRKRIRTAAINIWDWAVFKAVLPANPLLSVPKVAQRGTKRRAFRPEELAKLFPDELSSVWPRGRNMEGGGWALFFLICSETGLRPQEVSALHWEDWRPKAKAFIVSRAVDENAGLKGLKTDLKGVKKKAAPVSERVSTLLGDVEAPHEGLIFHRLDKRPQRVDSCGKVFNQVLDHTNPKTGKTYYRGVVNPNVTRDGRTLYCLRHAANTRFVTEAASEAVKEAQLRMGHTTEAMTANYDDPEERDLLERVGRA